MTGPSARPLRIGVLGCADIARRRMLPSLAHQPLVRLTAVAGRDAGRAERLAAEFGCAAVTGYEALLARDDIDAVYLPLPPHLHVEWSVRALEAGKHVLCEKPFAPDAARALAAVRVARERRLLLMESFMFLHHGQHAAVRRLVASGAIGEPRVFTAEFGVPRLPSGGSVGTLPEVSTYPVRAARLFLGDELAVLGAQESRTHGTALLSSPSGVTAQLGYGADHAYRNHYALWGSEGRVSLHRAYSTPDDHVPVVRLERRGDDERLTLPTDRQFTNVAGAFARAVIDGEDFEPYAAAILRQAELLDRISARAAASSPLDQPDDVGRAG
ncbi:Gfo/Idh/MocA family oxidoreductase [Streptomyces sp. NPDC020766]|uniref:Gfo/Idh/MocA family protein n=1 Tax=Streptomyces sp. NPDC020766 TaxID=3155011 RepID=UPI0033FFCD69